jgi:hypothetical protein
LSSCRAGAIFATVKLALAPDTLADPAGLDTAGLPNRFPGPVARLPRRASLSRSRRRPAGVQRRRDLAVRRPVVVRAPDAKDWRLFTTGLFDADLNEPDLLAVNHRAATARRDFAPAARAVLALACWPRCGRGRHDRERAMTPSAPSVPAGEA